MGPSNSSTIRVFFICYSNKKVVFDHTDAKKLRQRTRVSHSGRFCPVQTGPLKDAIVAPPSAENRGRLIMLLSRHSPDAVSDDRGHGRLSQADVPARLPRAPGSGTPWRCETCPVARTLGLQGLPGNAGGPPIPAVRSTAAIRPSGRIGTKVTTPHQDAGDPSSKRMLLASSSGGITIRRAVFDRSATEVPWGRRFSAPDTHWIFNPEQSLRSARMRCDQQ